LLNLIKKFGRSSNSKTSLFVGFIDVKDESQKSILNDVAQQYKGKIMSTFMDGVQNEQLASRWGASGKKFPTAALISYSGEEPKLFLWDEENEPSFQVDALKQFIENSIGGTYKSYKKSEPIPETNDGPVKIVVGKNFESLVNDNTKDVLVEFYAPWCGHCQKLAPIYEKLGQKFSKIDSIVIAKMDATANAVPEGISVRGFPTLFFFPAGDKTPVPYNGNRELDDLVSFIVEYARQPIDKGLLGDEKTDL